MIKRRTGCTATLLHPHPTPTPMSSFSRQAGPHRRPYLLSFTLVLLVLLLLTSLPARAQDVSGSWDVVFKGSVKAVLTLQQSGSSVTGSITTADGTPGQLRGQMVGNELRLARDTGAQTIQHYQARVQGPSFSGTYWNEGKYPDQGSFDGQRATAPAPAPAPAAALANVAGAWNITFKGSVRSSMTLQQSGDQVSGFMSTTDGTPGQLRGVVVGQELNLSRDTGHETIQKYRVRVNGDHFDGNYWNEGRYPDQGSFSGVRGGGVAPVPAPVAPAPPPVPINLNGSWQNNLLHIFQEGERILITASWKQPSGNWVIWLADGRIGGRRFSLSIRYSSMTAAAGSVYQGDFTLSDDGHTLNAEYSQGGRVVDRQIYRRDR